MLAAGVLIGFGAKTAGGCTSGNGLSASAMCSPAGFAATATKAHKELRARLAELEALPKNGEAFLPKVSELKRAFRQHARDEAKELLPAVQKALSEEQVQGIACSVGTFGRARGFPSGLCRACVARCPAWCSDESPFTAAWGCCCGPAAASTPRRRSTPRPPLPRERFCKAKRPGDYHG
ncbi:hypothetical protein B4Q13_18460, partial [Lacticaseibacillus rhamnosus]